MWLRPILTKSHMDDIMFIRLNGITKSSKGSQKKKSTFNQEIN